MAEEAATAALELATRAAVDNGGPGNGVLPLLRQGGHRERRPTEQDDSHQDRRVAQRLALLRHSRWCTSVSVRCTTVCWSPFSSSAPCWRERRRRSISGESCLLCWMCRVPARHQGAQAHRARSAGVSGVLFGKKEEEEEEEEKTSFNRSSSLCPRCAWRSFCLKTLFYEPLFWRFLFGVCGLVYSGYVFIRQSGGLWNFQRFSA